MSFLSTTAPLARYEVNTGSVIADGAFVALNSAGKAVPGADTSGLVVVGALVRIVDAEAEAGDGIRLFANKSGALLTRSDRGKAAHVTGAAEVGNASTNKIAAGIVVDVTGDGVYIDMSPTALAAARALITADSAVSAAATNAAAIATNHPGA